MQHGLRSSTKRLAPKITPSCLPLSLYAIHLPYRRTSYSSARIVSAFSGTTATDTVAAECIMPPLLQAPASSTTLTKPEPSACVEPPDTRCDGFDDLLATCISTLGVPGGRRARESLRCVLQAWGEKRAREKTEVSVSIVRLSCLITGVYCAIPVY